MRYKCLGMALSSISIGSETGPTIGGLGAVFCFVLAVFSMNLVSEAVEEVALLSYGTFDFWTRLDLRKSMFKDGASGPIL